MAQYSTFIPQNIALKGAKRIGIYNNSGNRVGFIPLGNLEIPVPERKKLYSFGALSDVHYQYETGAEDFHRALTYLNETEDVAFTCICGDLTSNGTDAELTEYKTAVDSYSADTPVYAIAGNHDTYQGLHDSIETYTGQPLYYSFTHGDGDEDDVFIMVGICGEAETDLFRPEILQWLYETLEENRNKRCFLFQHIPTYEGSGDCLKVYGGTKLNNETTSTVFKSLLSHYKNVIHFHGHSHMRFRLQEYGDNANYDNYFGSHSVHIPALAVQRDANAGGNGFVSYIDGSEGYVVDVYKYGIHLRGRDFVNEKFLPIASYWLDTTLKEVEPVSYTDPTGTISTNTPAIVGKAIVGKTIAGMYNKGGI
jgi:Icc-related predicted phosphoesterase